MLATQPIGTPTVAAAKTILTVLYLFTESLALYGLGLVPFIVKGYWAVVPGMLVAIVLATLASVVLVYLLYGFVLRFYDSEKLKDLITVLQIILSVVVVVGSQLISRMTALISLPRSSTFPGGMSPYRRSDYAGLPICLILAQDSFPGLPAWGR